MRTFFIKSYFKKNHICIILNTIDILMKINWLWFYFLLNLNWSISTHINFMTMSFKKDVKLFSFYFLVHLTEWNDISTYPLLLVAMQIDILINLFKFSLCCLCQPYFIIDHFHKIKLKKKVCASTLWILLYKRFLWGTPV